MSQVNNDQDSESTLSRKISEAKAQLAAIENECARLAKWSKRFSAAAQAHKHSDKIWREFSSVYDRKIQAMDDPKKAVSERLTLLQCKDAADRRRRVINLGE